MLTGEIRSQIDSIWSDFWASGVANPLSVIEQMTYLLFIKRLDDLHTLEERKSQTLKIPRWSAASSRKGGTTRGDHASLRWSRLGNFEPREMMEVVDEHVFPFPSCTQRKSVELWQADARRPPWVLNPALLAKVVEKLDPSPWRRSRHQGRCV